MARCLRWYSSVQSGMTTGLLIDRDTSRAITVGISLSVNGKQPEIQYMYVLMSEAIHHEFSFSILQVIVYIKRKKNHVYVALGIKVNVCPAESIGLEFSEFSDP